MSTSTAALLDLQARELVQDPYAAYEELRARGGVMFDPKRNVCYVASHEAASHVLRGSEQFSSKFNGFESTLIYQDGEAHARIRKRLMPAFSPAKVDALEDAIRSLTQELVGAAKSRGECDFVNDVVAQIPSVVVAWMLGVGYEEIGKFPQWSRSLISTGHLRGRWRKIGRLKKLFGVRDEREKAIAEIAACEAFVKASLELDRDETDAPVIRQSLNEAMDGSVLTPEERVDLGLIIILAGTETTANLMSNSVLILSQRPDLVEALRADRSLMTPFIDEVLRFESPVQRKGRRAIADFEIGGVAVPAGARVEALIGAANRDPAEFPDPAQFRIDRVRNRHLTFGIGSHFCLGQRLARLEAAVLVETMLDMISTFSLSPRQGAIVYPPNLSVRGPQNLRLQLA